MKKEQTTLLDDTRNGSPFQMCYFVPIAGSWFYIFLQFPQSPSDATDVHLVLNVADRRSPCETVRSMWPPCLCGSVPECPFKASSKNVTTDRTGQRRSWRGKWVAQCLKLKQLCTDAAVVGCQNLPPTGSAEAHLADAGVERHSVVTLCMLSIHCTQAFCSVTLGDVLRCITN